MKLSRHAPYGCLAQKSVEFRSLGYMVSCANYATEIMRYIVVCLMTGDMWCIIYVIVGAAAMTKWALAKHANYRKQFGGTYPKRKAVFPGIL